VTHVPSMWPFSLLSIIHASFWYYLDVSVSFLITSSNVSNSITCQSQFSVPTFLLQAFFTIVIGVFSVVAVFIVADTVRTFVLPSLKHWEHVTIVYLFLILFKKLIKIEIRTVADWSQMNTTNWNRKKNSIPKSQKEVSN